MHISRPLFLCTYFHITWQAVAQWKEPNGSCNITRNVLFNVIYSISYIHNYFCFYAKQVLFLCGKNWKKTTTVPRWRLLETWDRCSWNRWAFFQFPGATFKILLLSHSLCTQTSSSLLWVEYKAIQQQLPFITVFRFLLYLISARPVQNFSLNLDSSPPRNLRSAALFQSIL